MRAFHRIGIIGSLVLMGLVGCSNAAREASRNDAPVAQQVMLSTPNQPAHVGTVLQGSYQYSDPDGDSEKDTLRAWLRDGSPIEGANQDKYTATAQDSGKRLQFRVTPVAASGKSPGEAVVSTSIAIENSAPVVTLSMPRVGAASIRSTGVGSELSVDITYSDVDDDAAATAEIRWLQDDFAIPGATSSTYTVKREDINHDLVAEVTPIAQQGVARGTAVRSPSVFIVNSFPVAQNVKVTVDTTAVIVGSVLTASYTYFDADGDPENKNDPAMQEWQWLRNGEPIIGANALEYTLTAADANARIQFTVMPHASKGNSPGEMVTTEALTVTNSAPQAGTVGVSGASVSSSVAVVGDTLHANYSYSDLDLDPEGASVRQWVRGTTDIPSATGVDYTITAADSGSKLAFKVTPVASQGSPSGAPVSSTSITVTNSAPVAKSVTLKARTTPISIGTILDASYVYFDADNDPEITGGSSIQWLRDGVKIANAQGLTYTLVSADVGTGTSITIAFEVTPMAKAGPNGSATRSNGISNNNSAPTATNVFITPSTAMVNTVLTGNYTYSDTDVPADPQGTSLYAWSNGTTVIGTAKTYTVKAADAHKTLTFKVTPVASTGTSPGVAVTSPGITIGNSAPSITGLVIGGSTNGVVHHNMVVTASYSFQDPDLDVEGSSTYQWLSNGIPIGGQAAQTQTYTITGADIDKALTVHVTPKDNFVPSLSGTLVVSPAITPVNLMPVASNVVVTGTAVVGQMLIVSYLYNDHELDAQSIAGSKIRWLRAGASITGATGSTYTLTSADGGKTIAAEVTPIAQTGTITGLPVLSNSVSVAIPNTAPVANNVTLSTGATAAAVAGTELSASYTYFDAEGDPEGASTTRWLRNGVAITSAVGLRYTATPADVGQSIEFEVTPKAASGILSGSATPSNGIAINFTIGGTVSGLAAGASILLQNGTDQAIVDANGPFAFAAAYSAAAPYDVTIQTPPANQPCERIYGKSTIKGADVTNIDVFCGPPEVARFDPGGALVNARQLPGVAFLDNGKVFVAGGLGAGGPLASVEFYDPTSNNWSAVASMGTARYIPTATRLLNGKILVVGGDANGYLASTELYDPAAAASNAWSAAGSLTTARYQHSATLLSTGKVLVVGGYNGSPMTSAELYDPAAPAATAWSVVAPLTTARYRHTATLLPGDKVMVISGEGSGGGTVEIYDPSVNPPLGRWSSAPSLPTLRWAQTTSLLNNGKVLVAGGRNANGTPHTNVDIYDPKSNSWMVGVANLTTARYNHTAALLPNGKVLVVGGLGTSGYISSAEIYDPDLNTWSAGAQLAVARENPITLALPSGQALVAGGANGNYLASTELFTYPGTGSAAAPFTGARILHTATYLPPDPQHLNGQVLVAGGLVGTNSFLTSAQIYDPTTKLWSATTSLTNARAYHTATLLPPDTNHPLGQVLITGGWDSSSYLASAELYDPSTKLWSAAKNMLTARGVHTATYLPPDSQHLSGQVLVAGGFYNGTAIANAELYDPAKNTWSSVASLQTARTSHTATLLPNGKILIAGGASNLEVGPYYSSAELFDPADASKGWVAAGNQSTARRSSTATLLPNGLVVIAGGWDSIAVANTDIYDSANNTWLPNPPNLVIARAGHTATLLPTGKILISGGKGISSVLASSELYDPVTKIWSSAPASLLAARYDYRATRLANGTVLFTGGYNSSYIQLDSAEIYW